MPKQIAKKIKRLCKVVVQFNALHSREAKTESAVLKHSGFATKGHRPKVAYREIHAKFTSWPRKVK
jgi:hypothetical protein